MNKWSKVLSGCLIALMAVNAFGTAYYLYLKRQRIEVREPVASAIGAKFPPFSGIDVEGRFWQSRDSACRVIRVTDDDCSFCKKDMPAYGDLIMVALGASCEIIEISPMAGQMTANPRDGVVQLEFVDTDLGSTLYPFVTPQTVILDGQWHIKWTKRGMLDRDSLAKGLAVLESFLMH